MNYLKSYQKKFVLLGNRQYVQGSTITYGLLEAINHWGVASVRRIQANMHTLLNEHGQYDLFHEATIPQDLRKTYCALFHLVCDAHTYLVGLKGDGVRLLTTQPYNEEKIIEGHRIVTSKNSIDLTIFPGSPSLNIMIALNKKLANHLFPAKGYGQWFLSRYDLAWSTIYLTEPQKLEIKLVGKVGMSHIHSTVTLGSEKKGSIYFSRQNK